MTTTEARAARIETFETLFKALADRTRLRILGLLLGGEVCVCDIHESLKIPQPKASRHLAYLRRAGLVEARKKGLWVHYRLAPAANAVMGAILDAVGHGLGHVPAVGRDRQRLDERTGCCAPLASVLTSAFACCAPEAELKFGPTTDASSGPTTDASSGPTTDSTPDTTMDVAQTFRSAVTAASSTSTARTADDHPHSPDPSSSGESSA